MTSATALIQKSMQERAQTLEDQQGQVTTFLAKAERQIGGKAGNDELNRVSTSFAEQLQETRNVLQAQMDIVRARAERSADDFERVVGKLDAAAMKSELAPVSDHVKQLQEALDTLGQTVDTKASEDDVAAKLEELVLTQHEHKQLINTKADNVATTERHEQHVSESSKQQNALREVTEHLGISINSVEESVNLVAAQTATKAETRDVHEMMRMNEHLVDIADDLYILNA